MAFIRSAVLGHAKEKRMGARQKINSAAINGCLVIAGLLAAVTESWAVLFLAFMFLTISCFIAGDIRPMRCDRRRRN